MKQYDERDVKDIDFTKFKIVVETEQDKQEIMDALEHFHDNGYDSNLVTPNQLAHEYLNGSNIIIDKDFFKD